MTVDASSGHGYHNAIDGQRPISTSGQVADHGTATSEGLKLKEEGQRTDKLAQSQLSSVGPSRASSSGGAKITSSPKPKPNKQTEAARSGTQAMAKNAPSVRNPKVPLERLVKHFLRTTQAPADEAPRPTNQMILDGPAPSDHAPALPKSDEDHAPAPPKSDSDHAPAPPKSDADIINQNIRNAALERNGVRLSEAKLSRRETLSFEKQVVQTRQEHLEGAVKTWSGLEIPSDEASRLGQLFGTRGQETRAAYFLLGVSDGRMDKYVDGKLDPAIAKKTNERFLQQFDGQIKETFAKKMQSTLNSPQVKGEMENWAKRMEDNGKSSDWIKEKVGDEFKMRYNDQVKAEVMDQIETSPEGLAAKDQIQSELLAQKSAMAAEMKGQIAMGLLGYSTPSQLLNMVAKGLSQPESLTPEEATRLVEWSTGFAQLDAVKDLAGDSSITEGFQKIATLGQRAGVPAPTTEKLRQATQTLAAAPTAPVRELADQAPRPVHEMVAEAVSGDIRTDEAAKHLANTLNHLFGSNASQLKSSDLGLLFPANGNKDAQAELTKQISLPFNQVTNYLTQIATSARTPAEWTNAGSLLGQTAERLLESRNYIGLEAYGMALGSADITTHQNLHDLGPLRQGINPDSAKQINQILDPTGNSKHIKNLQKEQKSGFIPATRHIQTDLTFTGDGNPDIAMRDNATNPNFFKAQLCGQMLSQHQAQLSDIPYAKVPEEQLATFKAHIGLE